ncbi:tetratricopeptide repeat protein [Nodosilinea sp. LEGE 07298]|uniref:tetratricopeptide repeat protein n=1 Tax=Nodosilinea sp. LEGE 07298 TaxID=2777970 RepID=UPI0018824C81|nr:tetratricopeptide repeat protein [Nodosilinea sp. LEGE 07298]MBE9109465.1 tetratricopeptide repeat protein [Nodosilinea sp. LEGE 07298]
MNYRISAPGFLLAVLLSGGVVPASAQGELSQELVAQPESSAITNPETPLAGTAESALVEGQQAYHQGQLPLALERLSQAIAQFEAAGNADGVAAAQVAIAHVYITMENLAEAAAAIQAALSYYQAEGNVAGEAQALVNLGALQDSEENYDAALASLQRATELSKQAQDDFTQGIALLSIGAIYGTQEDYANALSHLDQALPLLRDDSDALRQGYYQASALMFKAFCLMGLEEFDQARVLVEPIQAINQSLQHPAVNGYLLFIQGTFAAQEGDVDKALSNYRQSIALIQEWGFDRETEVLINSAIGGIYFEQQDFEQASQAFDRILAVLAAQNNVAGQLEFLFQIGNLHQENKYYAQAQTYYEAALPHAQATGRTAEGTVLNRIGLMLYFQEQYEQALEFFLPALEAIKDVSDHANEIAVLGNLADTYQQLGKLEKVEEYRLQVLAWHQENVINAENNENYDSAIASLNQLYEFNRDQSQHFLSVGDEYLKSDPQAARNSASDAVEAGNLALNYAQQLLHIAQTQNLADWLPTVNYNVALSFVAIGQAYTLEASGFTASLQLQDTVESEKRALEFYEQAIPFALASDNETMINLAYGGFMGGNYAIGVAYNSIAKHEKAIEFILKALDVSRQVDDRERELNYLSTLDHSYTRLAEQRFQENEVDEALAYLETGERHSLEIIELSEELDDLEEKDNFIKQALNQLWRINSKRREIYESQELYEKALESAYIALDLAPQLGEGRIDYTIDSLATIASLYNSLNRYADALLSYNNLEEIASEREDFVYQSLALMQTGLIYTNQGRYDKAIEQFEKSFKVATDNSIFQYQTASLTSLSGVYAAQGNYTQAMEELTTALALIREGRNKLENELTPELLNQVCYIGFSPLSSAEDDPLEDLSIVNYRQSLDERRFEETRKDCIVSSWYSESAILHSMGSIHSSQGRYLEALDLYNQSLAIDQEYEAGEVAMSGTLSGIAGVYESQGNYERALIIYEQILNIYDRAGNRLSQARTLNNIGIAYENKGQYSEAFDYYQRALAVANELDAPALRNSIVYNMAASSSIRGDFQDALNTYYETLEADRSLGRRADEAIILNTIGGTYYSQGQLDSSSQAYNEALAIIRDIGARNLEIGSVTGLGNIAEAKGDYGTALSYYQQALEIAEEIDSQVQVSITLHSLGFIYLRLGQYATALDYYQRSLGLDVANGSVGGQALTLNSMAGVYYRQQQYDQAIDYNQQALAIHQDAGNLLGQVRALDGIGIAHERQSNYEQALAAYQEALDLVSNMDARFLQASVLNGLGLTYAGLGDTEQAMDYLEQALAINRAIGNPAGEALALADMGKVLTQSGQQELAIAFYKQSVNTREGIRVGLQELDQSLQQSYVDTVADTYRELADLLLQQNRVLEAQRVLDLLKVQELDDYLNDVRSNVQASTELDLWEPEQYILDLYNQTIQEGIELAQLDANRDSLNPEEEQRRQDLVNRQDELRAVFNQLLGRQDVQSAIAQLQTSTNNQTINIQQYNNLQGDLRELNSRANLNAVLLYPLILDNRLELVLIPPYGAPIRRTVAVESGELNRAIVELGQALKDPEANAVVPAQQLYQWLIAELEEDLAAANAETIIYAPDGALRYIPLAALHDGDQWLAQRFAVTHITAASIFRFDQEPTYQPDNLQLLAAACVQCSFEVKGYRFGDLPHAGVEVETLAAQIPNTELRLNEAFSASDLRILMRDFSIVHLATHAKFLQGQGNESFIVTGDRNAVSLSEMRSWNLDADLVVLSACETAVGEAQLGSGIEILGFGYQMQDAGAKAAIASLWQVDDGGTQVLMNAFYAALQAGYTKAEALQLAQQALIAGDLEIESQGARADFNLITARTGLPAAVSDNLDHPYYWAPFILIGNGL